MCVFQSGKYLHDGLGARESEELQEVLWWVKNVKMVQGSQIKGGLVFYTYTWK